MVEVLLKVIGVLVMLGGASIVCVGITQSWRMVFLLMRGQKFDHMAFGELMIPTMFGLLFMTFGAGAFALSGNIPNF